MYVPPAFREDRPEVLGAAIRASGLAILISEGPEGITASHVPMLLEDPPGQGGALVGHIARANPQWRTPAPEIEALAIFPGPDAYISPNWYATKHETGEVVPTWNYVAVHVYGRVRFFDDPQELLALVTLLTERQESAEPVPWAVSDAPEEFVARQLKGIVGFRLRITRLEGKWKMSQNRPERDRAGVVEGLKRRAGEMSLAVAERVAAPMGEKAGA